MSCGNYVNSQQNRIFSGRCRILPESPFIETHGGPLRHNPRTVPGNRAQWSSRVMKVTGTLEAETNGTAVGWAHFSVNWLIGQGGEGGHGGACPPFPKVLAISRPTHRLVFSGALRPHWGTGPHCAQDLLCSQTQVQWVPVRKYRDICIYRYGNEPSREIKAAQWYRKIKGHFRFICWEQRLSFVGGNLPSYPLRA